MVLLLMAAGSGSRYGKLKQFDDLGPKGEFLMEFSIHDAIKNGFNHIVVITKAENKVFLENHLSQRIGENIKLDVLVQRIDDIPQGVDLQSDRQKPWGTAHAVWTARHVISSPFVIINADDYYGQNAFHGAAQFIRNLSHNNKFAIVGYRLKDTLSEFGSVSRGVCTTKNEKLSSIKERTKIVQKNEIIIDEESETHLDPDTTVSMNFWICTPTIFDYTEPYFKAFLEDSNNHEKNEIYLPFLAQEMMKNEIIDVQVIVAESEWFGVTYYADKQKAVDRLKALTDAGKYPSPLWP